MDQKSWQLVATKPWQTNNVGKKHAVPAGSPRPAKTPGLKEHKAQKESRPHVRTHNVYTHTKEAQYTPQGQKNGSPRTCRLQRGPREGRGARTQRMRMSKIKTTKTYLAYCRLGLTQAVT